MVLHGWVDMMSLFMEAKTLPSLKLKRYELAIKNTRKRIKFVRYKI